MPSPSEEHDADGLKLGPSVEINGHAVLCGTCSWTDKTLVQEADWYPERTMIAAARLQFYAAHFPLAEIDSTYYAPRAEQQARLWAQRTPEGFCFEVKAYSLLTGHPTKPQSLWKDLREGLSDEVREERSLYASHLGPEALDERRSLRPCASGCPTTVSASNCARRGGWPPAVIASEPSRCCAISTSPTRAWMPRRSPICPGCSPRDTKGLRA